jgi:hypothetical protein
MFSSKKKKIQVKSVEEYLRGSDTSETTSLDEIPPLEMGTKAKTTSKSGMNMKSFIIQAAVVIIILALLMTALSQISTVKNDVAELQHKDGESQALKNQITDLSAKLEKSNKKVEDLTDRIAGLERELDGQKSQKAAAEAAKKIAITNTKKKPSKPPKSVR